MIADWKGRLASVLLGSIFIYAAGFKLYSPQDFADSIAAYDILPSYVVNIVALGLPVFEFLCGLLVMIGFMYRIALLGIISMMGTFILALLSAQCRHLLINCGCFPGDSWLDKSPWIALLRDAIFMCLALWLYTRSLPLYQVRESKA